MGPKDLTAGYSQPMDERRLEVPPLAISLAEAYEARGYGLWLVGGWVRDALIEGPPGDLDFATDSRPEESLEILHKWSGSEPWTMGIEFGTVGSQKDGVKIEVTTFRSEVYREDSRNPSVTFAEDLETDLSRRDFTINAMAIRVPGIEIIDPFGGMSDLAAGTIRTPLSPEIAFSDDPLRMLRALRLSSTLDFEVEENVLGAIASMHERLSLVSKERIRDELSKLMLGKAPSKALALASHSGLADEFLPELPALQLEQDPIHRHKDVFAHTLAVLDKVAAADEDEPDLALRLAAVLHDIGKPKTRHITPKGVTFHHHEGVGADMAEARLRDLRYPARLVDEVRELVYLHLRFHTYRLGWTDKAVRRYVRDAGGLLGKLNTLVRADCTTRNVEKARRLAKRMDELEDRIRELASKEELSRLRPALDGKEVMERLGVGPGRTVGDALKFLMELRIEEGQLDREEALGRLDEWYAERGSFEAPAPPAPAEAD